MRNGFAATRKESRTVVGIAAMAVSDRPGHELVTYALGSCLGICLHDPVARVAGMVHVMLPSSSVNRKKAKANPERFVDTGVPLLFHACYDLGARKDRIIVKVAGGAHVSAVEGRDSFEIGRRNFVALKKLLWKNGVFLSARDIGGTKSRTLRMSVTTGTIIVKSDRREREL